MAAVAALVVAGLAGIATRAAAAPTWSIVQSRGVLTVANTGLTVNFGSLPVTGDKIIMGFDLLRPSSLAVADGNSVALRRVASAGTSFLYAYDAPTTPSPDIRITWSHPASISGTGLEVRGLAGGDDVDGNPGTLTGATSPTGSPSYASSAAGELLYSFYSNSAPLVRHSPPAGRSIPTAWTTQERSRRRLPTPTRPAALRARRGPTGRRAGRGVWSRSPSSNPAASHVGKARLGGAGTRDRAPRALPASAVRC